MDVVRDLVNKAGGRVGIATKPGEYTRFRITLPHEKNGAERRRRLISPPALRTVCWRLTCQLTRVWRYWSRMFALKNSPLEKARRIASYASAGTSW